MIIVPKANETELSVSSYGSEVIISQVDGSGDEEVIRFTAAALDSVIAGLQKLKAELGNA